jgi:quinol-cytochrome oxidoreductase complex cytochrome b subunit
MEKEKASSEGAGFSDALMVCLSLASIFLLFFEVWADHTPQQSQALRTADTAIASIFLIDFCIRLVRAPNRARFMRCHW